MSDPKAQTAEPTMEEILASIRRIISENDEEQEAKKQVAEAPAPPPPSAPEPQPEPAPQAQPEPAPQAQPEPAPQAQPEPQPEPPPVALDSAVVLELTEMVTEDGSVVSLTEAFKQPEAVDSDYIEVPENIEDAASVTGDEEQTSDEEAGKADAMMETAKDDDAMDSATKPETSPPSAEEGLISAAASAAATANFAQLARSMAQEPPTSGNMPLGSTDRTLEDIVKEMIRPMLKDWLDRNLPQMVEHMVSRELDRMTRKATDI